MSIIFICTIRRMLKHLTNKTIRDSCWVSVHTFWKRLYCLKMCLVQTVENLAKSGFTEQLSVFLVQWEVLWVRRTGAVAPGIVKTDSAAFTHFQHAALCPPARGFVVTRQRLHLQLPHGPTSPPRSLLTLLFAALPCYLRVRVITLGCSW